MATEPVICKTISDFRNRCFDPGDKFRYAVIVPESTLSKLEDTEKYGYVRLRADSNDSPGTLVQVVTFSDDHDVEEFSTDGVPFACIRTKLQREIGLDPESNEELTVRIEECETTSLDGLQVHRVSAGEQASRDITTEGLAGYITQADMDSLDQLQRGDVCEIINPETGARIQLPIEPYEYENRSRNTIRLNGIARKLLAVDSKDEGDDNEVRLKVFTDARDDIGTTGRLSFWIGRLFVDYTTSHFRVLPGYDRDEGKNVIRMNRDAMKGLGIEENDRVLLSWLKGTWKQRNVRCQSGWPEDKALEPEEAEESSYGEEESLSVRIPSSERDNLNISVGDSIRIRRDMRYQAGKQVSLSAFGILGVIVGTNQLISMIFEGFSPLYVATSVSSIVLLSVVTVWVIMKPIRQTCQTPE